MAYVFVFVVRCAAMMSFSILETSVFGFSSKNNPFMVKHGCEYKIRKKDDFSKIAFLMGAMK